MSANDDKSFDCHSENMSSNPALSWRHSKKKFFCPCLISILTLWQYAMSKKVALPSDLKGRDRALASSSAPSTHHARGHEKPPSDVGKQLEAVKAHIEDLHVSNVAPSPLPCLNRAKTFAFNTVIDKSSDIRVVLVNISKKRPRDKENLVLLIRP